MKIEINEFYKVARNQTPKREGVNKRTAWENKAYSGRVQRDKVKVKDTYKLFQV
jgi:hypothetical protein